MLLPLNTAFDVERTCQKARKTTEIQTEFGSICFVPRREKERARSKQHRRLWLQEGRRILLRRTVKRRNI